jgi:hypothetical protein
MITCGATVVCATFDGVDVATACVLNGWVVIVVGTSTFVVDVEVALFDRVDRLISEAVIVAPPIISAAMIGPNLVRLHQPTDRFGLTT